MEFKTVLNTGFFKEFYMLESKKSDYTPIDTQQNLAIDSDLIHAILHDTEIFSGGVSQWGAVPTLRLI